MTTNTNNKREITGLTNLEKIDVTSKAQEKSRWSKVKKHAWIIKSKVIRFLLCFDDEELEQLELECSVRDAIRNSMTTDISVHGANGVTETMRNVYDEMGYDLSNFKHQDEVGAGPAPVDRETLLTRGVYDSDDTPSGPNGDPDVVYRVRVMDPGPEIVAEKPAVPLVRRAMVIPKFAASVVLALRAKFGVLSKNEANRLLIEREYLKLCRETTVRNVDVEIHRQFVINSYFTEGIMNECATVRTRIPKWLREAFGSVPNAEPTIC